MRNGVLVIAVLAAVLGSAPIFAYAKKDTTPVLMYHKIMETGPAADGTLPRLSLHPRMFEAQVRYLDHHGFTTLTMHEYVQARADGQVLPQKTVVMTFDDGTSDFSEIVLPLLKQYNMKATLFANPGYNGTDDRMTWVQLKEAHESGLVEVAAHTMSHANLKKLQLKEAHDEIAESKFVLEDLLGAPVRSFAYPFGEHTDAVRSLVELSGFESAVIANEDAARAESLYAIPRITIGNGITMRMFSRIVR